MKRRDRPTYATLRSTRPSYGNRIEAEYRRLTGHNFMPWQRQVIQTAYEYDINTGRLTHRYVVIKTPRQSGKTDLGDSVLIGRCMGWKNQAALLMAQDRNMSRRRLLDEIVDRRLEPNPYYAHRYRERRLTGSEEIRFPETHSWLTIAAVTKDAGHGLSLDVAYIDEVWTHEDFRALQALTPTMTTRPDPQLWLVSTEGDETSVVLDYWSSIGRESVNDPDSNVAYFEWSKPPDVDVYSEKDWPTWMPALGYTQSVASIRAEAETLPEQEFLRAFGNVPTTSNTSVFPGASWQDCGDPGYAPSGGLSCSADITPDRSRACIVICGNGTVEVVEDRPGVDWLIPRLMELDSKWTFENIAIDNQGPGATVISELEYRGLKITKVGPSELKIACGKFFDAVMSQQLHHRNQEALDLAVKSVRKRQLLDAWAFSRKGGAYISPAIGAVLSYWAYSEVPSGALNIW